jgi:hypothetical protein
MSTGFFYSIGQCLNFVFAQTGGVAGNVMAGTLQCNWIVGLSGGFPGMRMQWLSTNSGHPVQFNDGVLLANPGTVAPMDWVMLLGAPVIQVDFNGNIGCADATEWVTAMSNGLLNAAVAVSGVSTLAQHIVSFRLPGKTRDYISTAFLAVTQGPMVRYNQMVAVDKLMAPVATIPPVSNNWLINSATTYIGINQPASSPSSDVPFDLDIAINNGANMFSVMSKTFTEPGPDDGP